MNSVNLIQDAINIKNLLRIMLLHEENVNLYLRQNNNISFNINYINNETEQILDTSHNELIINYIIQNNNLFFQGKFSDIEDPLNNMCSISQEYFENNDDIIKINYCNHIFKREPFIRWLQESNYCPCCRINVLSQRSS
mgnify:CR=1 FL=1